MFPLRSHHLVSRTPAGEKAWHELRLPPAQRKLLGLLRQPSPVSSLLQSHGAEPGVLEELVWASARAGYIRVDVVEPSVSAPQPAPDIPVDEVDEERALQDLIARHRPPAPAPDHDHRAEDAGVPPVDGMPATRPATPRPPVDNTPLPAPSPESAAALARALMGGQAPAPAPSPITRQDEGEDAFLIKSSSDLMRALTGQAPPHPNPPPAQAPWIADGEDDEDSLPDVQLDAPYAADPAPKQDTGAAREDTFLRIAEVIKSRQAPPGAQMPGSPERPSRARGETDVAYAARLRAIEARAERQAAEQARREEMAARRREEAQQRQMTTRQGLSDRLRKALDQRDSADND